MPRGRALPALVPASEQRRSAALLGADRPGRPRGRRARHADPRQPAQALRHAPRDRPRGRRRRVPRGAGALRREHPLRVRAARRPPRRHRRQPAEGARGRARHRLLDEGGALRAHLRRVQHPARHVRRRARLPARHRPGVGRDHPARREAPLRLLGGDGAEADGDHAQGLRRRLRRDELQAHPCRLQLRVADGRDRGDGAGGRGQHHLPQGARRGRRPGRAPRPS